MPDDFHTISMAGSKYNYGDVDARVKELGFKDRSKYFQFLVQEDIERKKTIKDYFSLEILLLFLAIATLLILILNLRL